MCHPRSLEGCVSTFGRVVVFQPSSVCPFNELILGWEISLHSPSKEGANVKES
jgi:hypothetical protein